MSTHPVILIPARYASTRYPGKMLAEMRGKPLIQRVFETCRDTGIPTYVLTDSMRIANAVGKRAIMTGDAENGTDRCCEWINTSDMAGHFNCVINVQGDMIDIKARHITDIAEGLKKHRVCTLYTDLKEEDKNNPSFVKVVHNGRRAIWFGRGITEYGHHHLGVYGYHYNEIRQYRFLKRFEPEKKENLEQLRWTMNGIEIGVVKTKYSGVEINTPEDALRWDESYPLRAA
jgi:3-deoxy-manno-octulosonate cytidylyltransferase (CMP-KDO synthetase)|tara:strand:- start:126 stop:818 length:693 start_codon:yes stop_codon:yes gene_type:complete